MRALFLIFVLANIAFFAWDRYLRMPVDADARIRQVEITPEKIRIVGASSTPAPAVAALPKAALPEDKAKAAAACLEWGAFVGGDIQRAETAIAEAGFPAARIRRTTTDQPGYWVLVPPQKSRAEAAALTQQLKTLGVADFSIVQDPPEKRNAVSLGIFRTEDAARTLLGMLQKKGVENLVLERRENFFRQVVFYLREPNAEAVAKWNTLRVAVPGTEVRAVQCPIR